MAEPVTSRQEPEPPIWRNRPFMLLWTAQVISQTAQNAIWFGMMFLVQERSHSATVMSLAIMTLIVPSVLFGIVAGAYVDRWDKRAVLIGTNALRAVITLGYIVAGEFPALLYALFLVNFLFSTVGQFFAPAEAAVIPAIVPHRRLLQANSLFHLTFTASQNIGLFILGPAMLSLAGGANALFVVVALLFGLCALLVWPLPSAIGQAAPQSGPGSSLAGLAQDIREVGGFIRGDRVVGLAVAHWTLGAALGLVVAMLAPGFAENVLLIPVKDSIFVFAPAGVGLFAGAALLSRFGQHFDKHRLIDRGLLVVAAALIAMGLLRPVADLISTLLGIPLEPSPQPAGPWMMAIVMLTTFVAGVGFVAIIVASQTIIQERAPVALRGRVFAVQLMLSNVVTILPLLFLGALADLIGVGRTMGLLGLLMLGIGLVSIRAHGRLAVSAA